MGLAAEHLRNDRWVEFQRLARSKGSLSQDASLAGEPPPTDRAGKTQLLQAANAAAGGPKVAKGFMREFFEDIAEVQSTLRSGSEVVAKMDGALEDVLQATTQERQRQASEAIEQIVAEANEKIARSKRLLEAVRDKAEAQDRKAPGSAECRIRANMQQAMARKQQQLLLDFQRAQMEFKRVLEQQQEREMRLICPEASQEEVRQMIEDGETSTQLVMRRMAGAHATIFEELDRIRDKHQDILRLEASIRDLSQMFQEMAVLVDAQGEMLDSIELNVRATDNYVQKGVKELETTKKLMHNTRKWQCCISIFCMVILLVILGPILLR